jgi:hypothetical protein
VDDGDEGLEEPLPPGSPVGQYVHVPVDADAAVLYHVAMLVRDQEDALCSFAKILRIETKWNWE